MPLSTTQEEEEEEEKEEEEEEEGKEEEEEKPGRRCDHPEADALPAQGREAGGGKGRGRELPL